MISNEVHDVQLIKLRIIFFAA